MDDYNFDKTIVCNGRDFIQTLKDIGSEFGVGYDEILSYIPSDCETVSMKELINIAKKVKENRNSHAEGLESCSNFIKLIEESLFRKDILPF